MKTILCVLMLFIMGSCATKSDIDYKRQNQLKDLGDSETDLNYKKVGDIPQFRKMRYDVSPGFLLSLSHPSDDKLTGRYRVSFDGLLRLPYNVRINTRGLNIVELRKRVKKSYKKFFQKGANQVKLGLISKQYWIEVRGFVNKPGRYLVSREESIDKVIDKAGGLKGDLNTDFLSASIRQQKQSYTVSLNQFYKNIEYSKSFAWTGADTIFVNLINDDAYNEIVPMVTVLSGVGKPGKFPFKQNKDIFYYIDKSGGASANIKYDECYIVRTTSTGLKKIRFDITEMDEIPAIEKDDVIMLYSDHRTVWDTILQRTAQVLGVFSSIAIILLL